MSKKITYKKADSAHVLISKTCVNECLFCATADKRKNHQFPIKKDILEFIDESFSKGVSHLIFSGLGEPTLDPEFENYLEYAGRLGFKTIRLFTNGYNISHEKASKWQESGLTDVLLSIHGMKAGHDFSVGRRGAFEQIILALKIFSDLNYTFSVNTCLVVKNLTEIKSLIAYLEPFPIKIHSIAFPEWCGNVLHNSDEMVSYRQVSDLADQLTSMNNGRTFFDNIPYCLVNKQTIEQKGVPFVAYLDGSGKKIVKPMEGKLFHEKCHKLGCNYVGKCSGFEPHYIKLKGWGSIPERIDRFIGSNNRGQAKKIEIKKVSGEKKGIKSVEPAVPDYYHKDGITVIIRPTISCNADCIYCSSYQPGSPSRQMDISLVHEIYDKIQAYAKRARIKNICYLWHGGEPLLMGKKFYADVWSDLSDGDGIKINHLIQTNLLLVDQEWISLIKKHDVGIGTSADPIENIRVFKNGNDQFGRWMENLLLVCKNNINVGLVFTVTSIHLDKINKLHNFFKNIQSVAVDSIGIKVNPLYSAGKMSALEMIRLSLSPLDYGKFLADLWELWERDGRPYPLSPFKEWLEPEKLSCEFAGKCHENFLAVDHEGNAYNCARFADSSIAFGNILRDDFDLILQHKSRSSLMDRKTILRSNNCRDCDIWSLCHGGCPYFAEIYRGGIQQQTIFCEAYKYFFKDKSIREFVSIKAEH